jgi:hypothetical protein
MKSIRRASPATAALIGVALIVAGCGGASSSTTSSTAGQPPANGVSDAYKYSACMRDHGVSNFPDPQVSHSNGATKVAIQVPGGVGTSPQFNAAQTACRSILPAPSKSDLAQQAHDQLVHKQDLLAFARCLRDRGVRGFPDPNAQGGLTLQMVQAAGVDLTAPQVRIAALACVSASNGGITRASVLQATSGNPPAGGTQSSTASNP